MLAGQAQPQQQHEKAHFCYKDKIDKVLRLVVHNKCLKDS